MSDLSSLPPDNNKPDAPHWTARHGKPIIFVILTLVAVGVYLALTIPVAVFPETNFPRIVVGVDNGVFPIDQMLVTVTKPIEEAVNTVPGLDHLWSPSPAGARPKSTCSSTGSGYVPDAGAGECGDGAGAIHAAANSEDHRQSADLRRVSRSWVTA